MNRQALFASQVCAGMLLWFSIGPPVESVRAEGGSETHDQIAEWHIRLRGTKA